LGKGLPALSGRLVKKIRAELRDYADGSWRWHYERHYSDRGFDRRDVRANTDRTFIERTDAIKKKDPATGKSIRRKERAALILSGPVVKERRGFLSRLLDHDDAAEKAWRAATKYEARQARRRGGDAF
jgi:hypothetical protein